MTSSSETKVAQKVFFGFNERLQRNPENKLKTIEDDFPQMFFPERFFAANTADDVTGAVFLETDPE